MSVKLKPTAGSLAPLALTAAFGLLSTVPALAQSYKLDLLGVAPGSTLSQANGINSSGQVVGISGTNNPGFQATEFGVGSSATALNLPGSTSSEALAINDSGEIVGESTEYTAPGQNSATYAFVQSNGSTTYLDSSVSSFSMADGVNDSGEVVGTLDTSSFAQHAFIADPNGTVTDLDAAIGGYDSSTANGISNSGLVTGTVYGDYTYIYDTKTASVTFLPSLKDPNGGSGIIGAAINDNGDVTGYSYAANNEPHAFIYSNGALLDLDPNGSDNTATMGESINDKGQVVGSFTEGINTPYAFLYSNGSLLNLNTLIAPDPNFELLNASGINNNGQITGYGFVAGTNGGVGHLEAFLLTPNATPEPSSLTVVAVGLLSLGGLGLRARRAIRAKA